MTRVLLAYEGFYKSSGGIETHILDLIAALPHDFEVLTDRFPAPIEYGPVDFPPHASLLEVGPTNYAVSPSRHALASRPAFPVRLVGDYLRTYRKATIIEKSQWDIYHFHGPNFGSAVLRFARLLSSAKPVTDRLLRAAPRDRRLLTVHGLSSQAGSDQLSVELEGRMLAHFDYVVCVDRNLVEVVERSARERGSSPDVGFIPNGVDTRRFVPTPLRGRPRLSVGFVGRLEASRGIDFLAALAHDLPEDVELRLALAVSHRDRSRLPSILQERVRVVSYNLARDRMPEFYRDLDVLCNPVTAPGISRVTLESMACGRPVIMLAKGNRYPVVNTVTGYLVEGVEDTLDLLSGLAAHRDSLSGMSRRAREVVEREFDNRVVFARLDEMYKRIISKSAR